MEDKIVNSALWAAAGDALGWITELAQEGTVRARTGFDHVQRPIEWHRLVGGRAGVKVFLPAGTYSDDTQLRLAVSRAIRGTGVFDAEAFARIELTVWSSYALGAGRGTKAAAQNLSRRDVNWFSNFFDKTSVYVKAGGNGAAMRIQPHVWAHGPAKRAEMLISVLRDALITHGHPHGFAGAYLHALMLSDVLETGSLPDIEQMREYVNTFSAIPKLINEDRQLAAFWRPAWDSLAGRKLEDAIRETIDDAIADLEIIASELATGDPTRYRSILEQIGCLTDEFRGSGLKTVLASFALCTLFAGDIETALITSANIIESDTDTIATMAGAVLGVLQASPPEWPIQDKEYIVSEAVRLAQIRAGKPSDGFAYPDLSVWQPPPTQSDAVGLYGDGFALSGLGPLESIGKTHTSGDASWQWMRLPFGQTILSKRRVAVRLRLRDDQLPTARRVSKRQTPLASEPERSTWPPQNDERSGVPLPGKRSAPSDIHGRDQLALFPSGSALDEATERVIRSNFDSKLIGDLFNSIVDKTGSIEFAVSFASIIAKAKISRRRRSS